MTRRPRRFSLRHRGLGSLLGVLACTAQDGGHEGVVDARPGREPRPAPAETTGGAGDAPSMPGAGGARTVGGDLVGGAGAEDARSDGGMAGAEPGPPDGEGGSAGAPCEESMLGRAVVEHACLHVAHGPFEELTAAPDAAGSPALSAPHTVYRVNVSGGARSWLRFTPASGGSFAFLGVLPPTLRFTLADGSLVPAEGSRTTCPGLPEARVVDLDAASPLDLSWLEGDLVVVVEALAPFGDSAWELGCACREAEQPCAADADCCSRYCAQGSCESVEAPPCGGKAAPGEPCESPEGCCSGQCVDARCAPPLCRSAGPCVSDDECCLFCHDQDHCH